jgi:hypothetical protein
VVKALDLYCTSVLKVNLTTIFIFQYLFQERLPFSKAGFCHDTGSILGDHPNSFDSSPGHVDHRYDKGT